MGSKWKKIKMLLSNRACMISPVDPTDRDGDTRARNSVVDYEECQNSLSTQSLPETGVCNSAPCSTNSTPTRSRRRGFLSRSKTELASLDKSSSIQADSPAYSFSGPISSTKEAVNSGVRVSRSTCAICLETMKPGCGQALFTAECSHTFHFSCIVSNVKYGNQICPICRAKWKDVPWQAGMDTSKCQRSRSGSHRRAPSALPYLMSNMRQLDVSNGLDEGRRRHNYSLQFFGDSVTHGLLYSGEPDIYNDDEPLSQNAQSENGNNTASSGTSTSERVCVQTYAEVSAVPATESRDSFTILVHMKAPPANANANTDNVGQPVSRAPIDLVAVLDISGSMAGRKLVLLKQAMCFVARNLTSSDRLSVVVFSSTAKRIFPLQKMGEEGQRQLVQALDGLIATGGTNIAEGLRKGVKVLEDRREQNPVASIMLLSDGQDTYSMGSRRQLSFLPARGLSDSHRLVPRSIRHGTVGQTQIPVHTFGFGSDHDSATLHSISEVSGGTFSFIQTEDVVQDAFAQCIGGLLSVVVQDVQLTVSCAAPGVLISGIHSGSYDNSILESARHGIVKLGDMYAEEERDILVDLKLPASANNQTSNSISLVQAGCIYKDPLTQEIHQTIADELSIERPSELGEGEQRVNLHVDRQRNRLRTAEAITKARLLADQGNIEAAQTGLQNARRLLESSPAAQAGDQLCIQLESELSAIEERMANRHLYERSGRAYLLSAQSSHLRQRATTRGDSVDGLIHDYRTPSMIDMITLSQTGNSTGPLTPLNRPANQVNNVNNQNGPSVSSGRSLLRRASAKVRKSYGGS